MDTPVYLRDTEVQTIRQMLDSVGLAKLDVPEHIAKQEERKVGKLPTVKQIEVRGDGTFYASAGGSVLFWFPIYFPLSDKTRYCLSNMAYAVRITENGRRIELVECC